MFDLKDILSKLDCTLSNIKNNKKKNTPPPFRRSQKGRKKGEREIVALAGSALASAKQAQAEPPPLIKFILII
jgi:hypothetical protein